MYAFTRERERERERESANGGGINVSSWPLLTSNKNVKEKIDEKILLFKKAPTEKSFEENWPKILFRR